MDVKASIRELAKRHGFEAVGFTAPNLPTHAAPDLREFLALGFHGDMGWMADKADRRADPLAIWPETRSIIVVGHNYGPASNPLEKLSEKNIGNISCYAQGDDYHDVIKKKLKSLAREIAEQFGGDARVFVDTAPVMEKPLAELAGIGWQGKHTCIVSREFGSWLFLGEIFTTLPLEPDSAEVDHCGTCTSCLNICPTRAFVGPKQLDARKCISYLTIEHKGHIAPEFRKAIGNRIYGCDDCLAVCPWNKFAQTAQEASYHARDALEAPLLAELAALDDQAFRELFRKSPIKRIGRDRFIRNVLIAIGNSENISHLDTVKRLLSDDSPLVRAMAIWAMGELAENEDYRKCKNEYLPRESDSAVANEWR